MTYEENQTAYLDLARGVRLKVDVWVTGWSNAGTEDSPPDGDERMEVMDVTLLAYGRAFDLTPLYASQGSDELEAAVEDALSTL